MATLLKRIGTPEAAPPWGITAALTGFAAAFAAMMIGTTVAALIFGQSALSSLAGWSIGAILLTLFVNFTRNRTPAERQALGLNAPGIPLPLILLLSLGVAITLDLLSLILTGVASPVTELLVLFGSVPGAPVAVAPGNDPLAWLIGGMLLVVFQPIAEALMFRGVIYPALRQTLGPWWGLLATAATASLFHLLAYTTTPQSGFAFTWYALLLPFVDALYLTAVRAATGSTRASLVAHVGLGMFAILRALVLAG